MKNNRICITCSSSMRKMFEYRKFEYFRCPECQHVTTFPCPTQSEVKEHYQQGFKEGNYSVARQHNEVYQSAMNKMAGMIEDFFLKRNRSLRASSILDIGCFTGDFLYQMSKRDAQVYGVELQEEAVRIAEKRLPGKILNEDILSDSFSLSNQQFDIVTLLGVVEHVTNPVHLLKRVNKLLKTNGLLVIQTPDSTSLFSRMMGKYWPAYTPVEHIHIFSRQSLFSLLYKLGFTNIVFRRHWKTLSISYIYEMLHTFSPEFYRAFRPFYTVFPYRIRDIRLLFYIGEVFVFAMRK